MSTPSTTAYSSVHALSSALAPVATRATSELCLLLNPRSFRASIGDLAAAARTMARRWHATLIEASEPEQMTSALDRAVDSGSTMVAVLAGDGTVQAVVDHVARMPDAWRRPALLILAGGRTNLIAADLGGARHVLRKLDAQLGRLASGTTLRVQERHTLVVEESPSVVRHGFFLAGAQVDGAIRACHAHRERGTSFLHQGHWSNPYCLMKLTLARCIGRSGLPARPELQIDAGELGTLQGPTRLFAASTLSYASGLLNPFAERGEGALRMTAVSGNAQHFWWRLPRVLMGRFNEAMQPQAGYLSGRCERVAISGISRYTLDGEKFDFDPTRVLTLRVGPALRFVVS